jgi:crossover junction endodeoxyribonuclease RuvC
MKVLAIDPGFGRCGIAVLSRSGGKDDLLYSDCIETPATNDFNERLLRVVTECARIARAYEPDAMALEKLYFQKNQKTAMHVAEVRGALINTAAELGIPLSEYTPGEVKVAATGWGNADKAAVARMVHTLLKIDKKIEHDDEYDAIAIGITHLARSREHVQKATIGR